VGEVVALVETFFVDGADVVQFASADVPPACLAPPVVQTKLSVADAVRERVPVVDCLVLVELRLGDNF
jgi:hypothetical protein